MIRRFLNEVLLAEYKHSDFIQQQKAKVLSIFVFIVMVILLMIYSYVFIDGSDLLVGVPTTVTMVFCLFVLYLIKIGHYNIGGHLLLSVVMIAAWVTMFIDNVELLPKADTIVYIVGIFSMTSLFIDKQKGFILVYWTLNLIGLIIFCYHLSDGYQLSFLVLVEYFMDNIIMLFLVAVISYQVIDINETALEKANEATLKAEREGEKNRELSQTLEQKVVQRTMELVKKNEELEKEIRERNKAEELLKDAQSELIAHAHKSGMAEIAADTLHNIGNVLNSVKTSAYLIKESVEMSPRKDFSRACQLIQDHEADLQEFLFGDEKGSKIIEFLFHLQESFDSSYNNIDSNIDRLNDKIETIAQVIMAQQNYAGGHFLTELLNVKEILEDAISLVPNLIAEQGIQLEKVIAPVPAILGQKTKLLHTLVNLINNAVQATVEPSLIEKRIKITVQEINQQVVLEIADTGNGIAPEHLEKIFGHGFTTKKDGFGFGLHSCANNMNEMGASISVTSDGLGKGATFKLQFPIP